jgi:hypothetical protein
MIDYNYFHNKIRTDPSEHLYRVYVREREEMSRNFRITQKRKYKFSLMDYQDSAKIQSIIRKAMPNFKEDYRRIVMWSLDESDDDMI